MTAFCDSIRNSLVQYWGDITIADAVEGSCVVTVPFPTVDGRIVGVFIEPRAGDYYLVNDGGKSVNELNLQGVKITDSVDEYFTALAAHFHISYSKERETFQAGGKRNDLQKMIVSVGACSALAMTQLVGHVAVPQEPAMREQFGKALKHWARKRLKVIPDVSLKGHHSKHKFDFMATPIRSSKKPIMLSVLSPGSNSLAAAQRFGFKSVDLENTVYGKRPRVAVQDRSEIWSWEAKNIVKECADVVIEIPSGSTIDDDLIGYNLEQLVA